MPACPLALQYQRRDRAFSIISPFSNMPVVLTPRPCRKALSCPTLIALTSSLLGGASGSTLQADGIAAMRHLGEGSGPQRRGAVPASPVVQLASTCQRREKHAAVLYCTVLYCTHLSSQERTSLSSCGQLLCPMPVYLQSGHRGQAGSAGRDDSMRACM